jgi:site-specific DNA-methyltransferase (adenine-specific)
MEINKIYNEPCLETLKKMPNDFLDCVITSPPYWQLRDYGYIGQWGLEPTYQEYLKNLWLMMDEIYRVLKPTGTVWVNLGDTYGGNNSRASNNGRAGFGNEREAIVNRGISKCLMLIPHRFAIGCIDRGWIVRNDIIWAKRNGMPESCTDRFSKKHEYFFFMVKSEKYYFDLDSIRDKTKLESIKRYEYEDKEMIHIKFKSGLKENNPKGKNPGDVSDFWDINTKPSREKHYAQYNDELIKKPILSGCPIGGLVYDPFMGTGSTAEVCIRSKRNFIGSEMSKDYLDIANNRILNLQKQQTLF